MIIFGAGASFDSYVSRQAPAGSTEEFRLPLTDFLFSDRPDFNKALEYFDKAQPLIAKLRYLPTSETLEQVLEHVAEEAQGYSEARRQLAAIRYYLQWVIWECERKWQTVHLGATNHKTLFNRVEWWRSRLQESVSIVTFNYDTLIEKALSMFDLAFDDLNSYIQYPNYRVIKLHGSVNWVHPTRCGIQDIDRFSPVEVAQHVIRGIDGAQIQKPFEIQNAFPPSPIEQIPRFPAIAIPVQGKSSFECPDDHLTTLTNVIPDVDKLLVVGWRGQENHFTGMFKLLRKTVSVLIVAGNQDDANQTKLALERTGFRGVYKYHPKGFSDLIMNPHIIDQFLSTQVSITL